MNEIMEGKVPDVSRHPFTVPSASCASPPGPGLSSAGPRWCRACGGACTGHDCPCKAAGCACLCAVLVRKTQSPAVVVKESRRRQKSQQAASRSRCHRYGISRGEAEWVCLQKCGRLLILTGDFLSMGLMTNFLSLKEMFLISLQGKPIFGVSLRKREAQHHR